MSTIRDQLKKAFEAQGLGFLGLVTLGPEPSFAHFEDWLDQGRAAEMNFLKENKHLRQDPRGLLDNAVQGIVFYMPYWQGDRLQQVLQGRFQIAQYARLRDYHKSMRAKAGAVLQTLETLQSGLKGRVAIDSAPILERALASRTARGFIGKNTCFIHPDEGSFFLLGEILLDQAIAPSDSAVPVEAGTRSPDGGCGSCKRCQVFCPTGALDEAYRLDARRCLAYWTIEHRGTIPEEFWPWLKTYLFGCDLCQLACPYNRASKLTEEPVKLKDASIDPFLVACMDQAQYEQLFASLPVTRAKRAGLRRNALIALTVTHDPRLDQAIASVREDDAQVLKDTLVQIEAWRKSPDRSRDKV